VIGDAVTSPVTLGVVAALVAGKTAGIVLASRLAVRVGMGPLPDGVQTRHLVGVGAVAGIGFTVSIFVAELAFPDPGLVELAKIGVLAGSTIAGVLGASILAWRPRGA
jgi:NhaA family Na+:H+ antiporter